MGPHSSTPGAAGVGNCRENIYDVNLDIISSSFTLYGYASTVETFFDQEELMAMYNAIDNMIFNLNEYRRGEVKPFNILEQKEN